MTDFFTQPAVVMVVTNIRYAWASYKLHISHIPIDNDKIDHRPPLICSARASYKLHLNRLFPGGSWLLDERVVSPRN